MLELIPKKSIIQRQEERLASEFADELGSYFEKVEQEYVITAINEVLAKMNKRDSNFAKLILNSLKNKYPEKDFRI